MRNDRSFRFYPPRNRRIKKIRNYKRLTNKSFLKINDYCSEDDKAYNTAWVIKDAYYITYANIMGFICCRLDILGINYTISHDANSLVFIIHSNKKFIRIDLEIIPKLINYNELIEYIKCMDLI